MGIIQVTCNVIGDYSKRPNFEFTILTVQLLGFNIAKYLVI